MSRRPEHTAPPNLYYSETEAQKYGRNSHLQTLQSALTERAYELLLLPEEPGVILDIGSGTGISSHVLCEKGHYVVGVDISQAMLAVGKPLSEEMCMDSILCDMGQPLHIRPGTFDGCISISAIQWLCYSHTKHENPYARLSCFFQWLYNALSRGSRAVFQLFPESPEQIEMITSAAMSCNFGGGLVVDYPNSSKAKKYFLCLWAGCSHKPNVLPHGLNDLQDANDRQMVKISRTPRVSLGKTNKKPNVKSKAWILKKKQRQKSQNMTVRQDSAYTGRKRKNRF